MAYQRAYRRFTRSWSAQRLSELFLLSQKSKARSCAVSSLEQQGPGWNARAPPPRCYLGPVQKSLHGPAQQQHVAEKRACTRSMGISNTSFGSR